MNDKDICINAFTVDIIFFVLTVIKIVEIDVRYATLIRPTSLPLNTML